MGKVISVLNNKGGSGKTSCVLETAFHAGSKGKKVLVVDLDPQANATTMLLGHSRGPSIFDLFVDQKGLLKPVDTMHPAHDTWPNCLVISGSSQMSTIDGHIGHRPNKDAILRRVLAPVRNLFDLVLIDMAPAIDYLTLNALISSDFYHVPLDLSTYGLEGWKNVFTLALDVVESGANINLRFSGAHLSAHQKGNSRGVAFLTSMIDKDTNIRLVTRVPNTSRMIEAQRDQKPVSAIDPAGGAAVAYSVLADHFIRLEAQV